MSNDRLKYDRRWIERLQLLPQYMLVVEKLLHGWSLDAVADWIMEQPDRGPLFDLKRSTIRYYLNALNIRLEEAANAGSRLQLTLRAKRLAQLADELKAEQLLPNDNEIKPKQK